jgi:hypothetical protein
MNQQRARVLTDGLWIGLAGYVTVALSVGVIDVARGRSFFHTAAVLGSALFGRATGGAVTVTPEVVFPYNGIHLLTFLALGFLVAVLIREVEVHPVVGYLAFFLLLMLVFFSLPLIGALGALGGRDVPWAAVPWGSILVANALGAIAMAAYVRRRHPDLWRAMRDGSDSEEPGSEALRG